MEKTGIGGFKGKKNGLAKKMSGQRRIYIKEICPRDIALNIEGRYCGKGTAGERTGGAFGGAGGKNRRARRIVEKII